MTWYQLLVIIFSLLMNYLTYVDYKKKAILRTEWLFFSALWVSGLLLALFPKLIAFVPFKAARILDLVTISGIILLSLLTYIMYTRTKRTEKKLEDLTRKEALKKLKK